MAFLALPTWGDAFGLMLVCSTRTLFPFPRFEEPYLSFCSRISFIAVSEILSLLTKKFRYGPVAFASLMSFVPLNFCWSSFAISTGGLFSCFDKAKHGNA